MTIERNLYVAFDLICLTNKSLGDCVQRSIIHIEFTYKHDINNFVGVSEMRF